MNYETQIGHEPLAGDGTVSVVVNDNIADICFGHPKSNSLPARVLASLAEAVTTSGARDDVRAIVLRSYGTGPFCAGASFDELAGIRDATGGKEFFMGFARVIVAMAQCPKPIVARVQGKVVGGGVGLVAASDYAMATEKASLRLSELAVGIGPFVVGPAIERKVGVAVFGAMAFDADWRDASWGAQHGLYSRLHDSLASLDEAVSAFGRTLASANPQAVAQIKRITSAGTEHWPALLEERAVISGSLILSDAAQQTLTAIRAGERR